MLSAISSTKCSAIIWLRRRTPTLTRTTRRHRNSAQNWGSSANQGRGFSKRAQRIWKSLGIRSKVPARQNQHSPQGVPYVTLSGISTQPCLPLRARRESRALLCSGSSWSGALGGPIEHRLLLLGNPFERFLIGLLIHESSIWASFRPTSILWIIDLVPTSYRSFSMIIARLAILGHLSLLSTYGGAPLINSSC